MENKEYEIFILNPSDSMTAKICQNIKKYGFVETKNDLINREYRYEKEKEYVYFQQAEDWTGPYIVMLCGGISYDRLRKELSTCPECRGDNLQVTIFHCWRNATTDQMYEEGKLKYSPGAYDRHGTKLETHTCLECGCKWHNGAEFYYWNSVVIRGKKLTKDDLGIV